MDRRVDSVLALLTRRQHSRINGTTLARTQFTALVGADGGPRHYHQP